MDRRVPEFHQCIVRLLVARSVHLEDACAILTATASEGLTAEAVRAALACLDADATSPIRATLCDLGRILAGTLPTEEVPAPPRALAKFHLDAS